MSLCYVTCAPWVDTLPDYVRGLLFSVRSSTQTTWRMKLTSYFRSLKIRATGLSYTLCASTDGPSLAIKPPPPRPPLTISRKPPTAVHTRTLIKPSIPLCMCVCVCVSVCIEDHVTRASPHAQLHTRAYAKAIALCSVMV